MLGAAQTEPDYPEALENSKDICIAKNIKDKKMGLSMIATSSNKGKRIK